MFIFGDYEGLRVSQGITTLITVPSPALRQGITCSNPQPGVCTTGRISGAANPDPATGIDRSVLPYLALWHLPNLGLLGNGDTGQYRSSGAHTVTENFLDARVDYNISNRDSMFASYQYDPAASAQPDAVNNTILQNKTGRTLFALEETHIFSSQLVNTARVGLNRNIHTDMGLSAVNPAAADTALGATVPGYDNPQLDVPGVDTMPPGLNQAEQLDFWDNSYQAYDDVFLTRGMHTLTFGFNMERIQLNEWDPAPNLEYAFPSLYDFLRNNPTTLLTPVPGVPFIHYHLRSTIYGGYIQDEIHLRPNFTLNAGMRYEMSTVPSDTQGRLSVLTSPFNQSLATAHIGNGIFQNPTTRNFEPRVGLAWDPFGSGKTSVRAGFGFYDVLPLPYFLGQISTAAAPFAESGFANNLVPGDFPGPAYQKAVASPFRMPYVQQHPGRPYVMQWDLNVQRELMPDLSTMVAYVGSRGVHMPFRSDDINTTQPISTSAGYLWPMPGTAQVISPNVGQMDALAFRNDTYYNALEAQVTKRMSHGLQMEGSWTWSRAIDGGDGSIASDSFVNALPGWYYFLQRYRRGPSDFNITHNLTINFVWQIPTPSSLSGPASWIARGWQVASIATLRTGMVFTPVIGGDPLGELNYAPTDIPSIVRGAPGCGSLVNSGGVAGQESYLNLNCFALPQATSAIASQCVPFTGDSGTPANPQYPGTCANLLGNAGRNYVYGPGMVDLDFSLIKNTKIGERMNVEFRAEFFNVLNHSNFLSPIDNSTIFDSAGSPVGGAGFIDKTSTANREIQFGLKLSF